MPVVLALDQGTTSSRAIVFDRQGGIRALAQREFRQIYPRPGWVEHDPEEIWSTQLETAVAALGDAGVGVADVAAIGITNQRETTLVWDRTTGAPLCNAIVWQDRRTADRCEQLKAEGRQPDVQKRTGLVIDAYFSASKLEWILQHVDGARRAADAGRLAFGTVDSWLLFKLSAGRVHVTDVSNASRTMLWNIHRGEWDDELLALFDVPRSMLPDVRPSSSVYGKVAAGNGLDGIPVAGIVGDQQAALAGQSCTRRGQAKNTYGTGCFLLTHTGDRPVDSHHRLISTVAATREGQATQYAMEGSVFIGGAVVQWLRDGLGLIEQSSDVERLAASVEDSGDVFLVPAFAGLGAPHWDPYARGVICGLTRGTSAAHIARAALESIAYQVAELLDAMRADLGAVDELRVDGGAAVNDTLMQFQADVLRIPVLRPVVTETTALGAAYMAGLAVGFWSEEELAGHASVDRCFEPSMPADRVAELRARWTEAVQRARGWSK